MRRMLQAYTATLFCLCAAILLCVWRAVALFAARRPAVAQVTHSDYTQAQRDRDFGVWVGPYHNETPGWRRTGETIVYEDAAGAQHHAQVTRYLSRARQPDAVYMVWYDPADPDRFTHRGPFHWLAAAVLLAMAGGMIMVMAQMLTARMH
ncbi:MAG: hypothetical protein JO157_08890 [Acetobacteraceae bacterium]|nr:hypothetical protein [Acetobacteraceae bacterium]